MNRFEPYQDSVSDDPNKQHINLSSRAWDTIEADRVLFADGQEPLKLSAILNRLYENYLECIEDEYRTEYLPLPDFRKDYVSSISWIREGIGKSKITDRLKDTLYKEYINRCKEQYLQKTKGEGAKYRLSNKVLKALGEKQGSPEEAIFDKPGKYLTSFYERYADMPFFGREELYYYPTLKNLQDWIDRSRQGDIVVNHTTYRVVPYQICADPDVNYHYLAGMSQNRETGKFEPASFRVSRIESHSELTDPAKDEKREYEEVFHSALKRKGVQFLLNDVTEIRIRLDDKGKDMFMRQQHLRPVISGKENRDVYVFTCTQMQAEFYFFKFGCHAEVLSPESLRRRFAEMYHQADDLYHQ